MDQNQFDVLQTTLQVVSDLQMAPYARRTFGEQFTLSFDASGKGEGLLPFDIYVDRLQDGNNGIVYESEVVGAKHLVSTASVEPDGEKFAVEIVLSRAKNLSLVHPEIRLPQRMFQLVRASLDQHFQTGAVELFSDDLGSPTD